MRYFPTLYNTWAKTRDFASRISNEIKDIIRGSELGQLIRLVTWSGILQYLEEMSTFRFPDGYDNHSKSQEAVENSAAPQSISALESSVLDEPEMPTIPELKKEHTNPEAKDDDSIDLDQVQSHHEPPERTMNRPIIPTKSSDGTIPVDWYTTDDPENPQNWSPWKKFVVSF